jgi:hypothetical protein
VAVKHLVESNLFLQLLAVNLPPWGSFQKIALRDAAAIAAGLICGVTGLSHSRVFACEESEAVGKNVAHGRKKTDS